MNDKFNRGSSRLEYQMINKEPFAKYKNMSQSNLYHIKIRHGTKKDIPLLEKMLFEAVFWSPTVARPDMSEFFKETKLNRYLSGWGRPGDVSLIAETEDMPVGAAWYRLFKKDEGSYGFVDENTPEIGMAVTRDYRSQGLGRKLLRALILEASSQGFNSLSLSVDPDNLALKLYESEGFRKVGESGTSWTLLLKLKS